MLEIVLLVLPPQRGGLLHAADFPSEYLVKNLTYFYICHLFIFKILNLEYFKRFYLKMKILEYFEVEI